MSFPHTQRATECSRFALLGVLAASFSAIGCFGATKQAQFAYSPEAFVVAARAQAPELAHQDLVVPFQVTPEMAAKARDLTAGAQSDFEKAERLSAAITDEDGFGLHYDSVSTAPPQVTMERGHGNCLALTSIFIGLAREVGLTAFYVDASQLINDLRREEEVIVDSGHIAGAVRTGKGYTLIDYDGHVSRYRTFQIIDDITALAHYYNNLGFELIHEAQELEQPVDWDEVLHNFRLATLVRSDFARAYNNLGVAYTKLGDLDAAEAAYREAIAIDPESDAAYHNLGNLQTRRRDYVAAMASYDRALELRKQNPYLHYHRGLAQYRMGDLEAAEESFKRAIGLEREYIEPRNVLAQLYQSQGRVEEAEAIRATVQRLRGGNG